jgi:hypothetical protein
MITREELFQVASSAKTFHPLSWDYFFNELFGLEHMIAFVDHVDALYIIRTLFKMYIDFFNYTPTPFFKANVVRIRKAVKTRKAVKVIVLKERNKLSVTLPIEIRLCILGYIKGKDYVKLLSMFQYHEDLEFFQDHGKNVALESCKRFLKAKEKKKRNRNKGWNGWNTRNG